MKKKLFFAATICVALLSCNTENKVANKEIADVMTAETIAAMTPEKVLEDLLEGNARFVSHQELERNGVAQVKQSAIKGQYPQAIVLSCIDSRVPVELSHLEQEGKIKIVGAIFDLTSGKVNLLD